MRQLIWEKNFARAVKRAIKRQPAIRHEISQTLYLLQEDAFAPSLETHKLKGKLAGLWACSVGYDLRIVFVIDKDKSEAPRPSLSERGVRTDRVPEVVERAWMTTSD